MTLPASANMIVFTVIGDVMPDCEECPVMVAYGPGQFWMGMDAEYSNPVPPYRRPPSWSRSRPVHFNYITRNFAVAKYMVTRGQFHQFVTETGYVPAQNCDTPYKLSWGYSGTANKETYLAWLESEHGITPGPEFGQNYNHNDMQKPLPLDTNHPVACTSSVDTKKYIAWLNTKLPEGIPKFRMVEPIEYEYVARASKKHSSFTWGNKWENACLHANIGDETNGVLFPDTYDPPIPCNDGYLFTSPVGMFPPNPAGLYDIDGNLTEMLGGYYYHGFSPYTPQHRNLADLNRCIEEQPQCHPERTPAAGGSWYKSEMKVDISHYSQNTILAEYDGEPRGMFFAGFRVARDCRPTGPC